MDFGQAIKSVFTQYATFSGRASRSEFWWFYLFTALVSFGLNIVDSVLRFSTGYYGLGFLLGLVLLLPTLAVSCRRLHDSGRSGWWLLGIYLLTFVGVVTFFGAIVVGFAVAIGDSINDEYDTNYGVFLLVGLVGLALLIGSVVLWIVQMTRSSDPETNKYGPTTVVAPVHPGLYDRYQGPSGNPQQAGPSPYGASGQPAPPIHPPREPE